MYVVRPPAVAGAFYPGQAQALSETVARLLAGARVEGAGAATPTLQPKVLLVPHAGYTYSGPLAALAYAQLAAFREVIRRVVLLGPVHRVAVRGLALPGADAFATPLGEIAIDQNAVRALRFLPQVVVSPAAHALEHSLEVQLPFLQIVLRNFKLLPLGVWAAETRVVTNNVM